MKAIRFSSALAATTKIGPQYFPTLSSELSVKSVANYLQFCLRRSRPIVTEFRYIAVVRFPVIGLSLSSTNRSSLAHKFANNSAPRQLAVGERGIDSPQALREL